MGPVKACDARDFILGKKEVQPASDGWLRHSPLPLFQGTWSEVQAQAKQDALDCCLTRHPSHVLNVPALLSSGQLWRFPLGCTACNNMVFTYSTCTVARHLGQHNMLSSW